MNKKQTCNQPKDYFVKINDQDHLVKIKRNLRASRLSLKYSVHGETILVIPKNLSIKAGLNFLNRSKDWLEKQIGKSKIINLGQNEERLFKNGDTITVFSIEYNINHHVYDQKNGSIEINKNILNIYCALEDLHNTVISWLCKEAKNYFENQSRVFSEALKVKINKITIKDHKSRWGSCSSRGNINYSWRLSLAPLAVAEYLCAHEVSHLIEMNHSEKFWQIVAQLFPNYKIARLWLKKEGHKLLKMVKS